MQAWWCIVVLVGCVTLTGCPGAMVIQVDVEHHIRCTLVKHAGGSGLAVLGRMQSVQAVTLEECMAALERVWREWEQRR